MNLPDINKLVSQRLRSRRGFTMIELLVVISIIGVLAVAVLSSINPIEQINKGRDTRTRSDAAQLIGAIDRYISINEEFPWNTIANQADPAPATPETFDMEFFVEAVDWEGYAIDGDNWVTLLRDTAEVKDGFIERLINESNADRRFVISKPAGYSANVSVCFMPASNAFRQEAAADCEVGGKTLAIETESGIDLCNSGTDTASLDDDRNYICIP